MWLPENLAIYDHRCVRSQQEEIVIPRCLMVIRCCLMVVPRRLELARRGQVLDMPDGGCRFLRREPPHVGRRCLARATAFIDLRDDRLELKPRRGQELGAPWRFRGQHELDAIWKVLHRANDKIESSIAKCRLQSADCQPFAIEFSICNLQLSICNSVMRPLSHALPGALVLLLRETPLSDGKVTFAWRAAVGAALERVTAVKLDGRVLLVEAGTPQWAREVERSKSLILNRLQSLLGNGVVTHLEVRSVNNALGLADSPRENES